MLEELFGMDDMTEGPLLHAKFQPIGATCRPCGAKNLNIGLCCRIMPYQWTKPLNVRVTGHNGDPLSATRAASAQWRRRRHRQVSKVNNVPGVFARERQQRRLRLMSTVMR